MALAGFERSRYDLPGLSIRARQQQERMHVIDNQPKDRGREARELSAAVSCLDYRLCAAIAIGHLPSAAHAPR